MIEEPYCDLKGMAEILGRNINTLKSHAYPRPHHNRQVRFPDVHEKYGRKLYLIEEAKAWDAKMQEVVGS